MAGGKSFVSVKCIKPFLNFFKSCKTKYLIHIGRGAYLSPKQYPKLKFYRTSSRSCHISGNVECHVIFLLFTSTKTIWNYSFALKLETLTGGGEEGGLN